MRVGDPHCVVRPVPRAIKRKLRFGLAKVTSVIS